ncbi:response regulator [Rubellimicrobium mesophilum DSM 19309]|uniref:Response regulator n=1 Tax=Rubellimicrobium mesophilum DSM 19309 TaxID=442562 RepID=A0A017HKP7_9RHOB|nr:response regulator [Rubellimicrobium mesophilum]EYD74743.1 response regulator [Rubellimicrobium mesophilum DSM 19309]
MNEMSTVLLVEDNEDDIELIRYAFDKVGIGNPLVTVSDGDAAVAYVTAGGIYADRERYPLPGLVLLDLKLPRRSGFEVLDAIRSYAATQHTPVVVLTSSDQTVDIERAYRRGANAYLVKPVSRDALLGMVQTLDAFWIKLNRVIGA